MKDGGLAVASITEELHLHLHYINTNGDIYWLSPSVGQAFPENWQMRPNVATLSNGNIAVFSSDLVHIGNKYGFDGRVIYSIFTPDGKLVSSDELKLPVFIGTDLYYRAESDGTLSIISAPIPASNSGYSANHTGTRITGIGSDEGAKIELASTINPTKDASWLMHKFGLEARTAFDSDGTGYAVDFDYTGTQTLTITKQTGMADSAIYYGKFDDEKIDILISLETIHGTEGQDVFDTTIVNAYPNQTGTFDGGNGVDTIKIRADSGWSETKLMVNDEGRIFIGDGSLNDRPSFSIINIERIEIVGHYFVSDEPGSSFGVYVPYTIGTFALDIDGNAGQAYRLYQAAFDRTPDTAGLSYWIERLDSGGDTLTSMAASFINSTEFANTYGTSDTVANGEFVGLLYKHALARELDEAGYEYWVGKLDADEASRSEMLVQFSESDENVFRTSEVIGDGIWLA